MRLPALVCGRIEANEISYVWDKAIERFNQDILAGTVPPELLIHADVAHLEHAVRFMAAEPRYLRRLLAQAFMGFYDGYPPDRSGTRVVLPFAPGGPCYVFTLLPRLDPERPEAEYRQERMCRLFAACMMTKGSNIRMCSLWWGWLPSRRRHACIHRICYASIKCCWASKDERSPGSWRSSTA